MTTSFLLYCRPGFEGECAQETQALLAQRGASGYAKAERGAAYVEIVVHDATLAPLTWQELIFARQVLGDVRTLAGLDPKDRLTPLLDAVREYGRRFADVWVETPDSDTGAPLHGLARSFEAVVLAALRKQQLLDARATQRLHVLVLSGTHLLLARAETAQAAPWRGGVPRLKLPRDAPSRSALKIEEAWLTLMSEAERERWLAPGKSAVDLGAAPGGWTWQLARRSVRVTAVDNGALDPLVLETGLVDHVRADGFRFRPKKTVDWVVCDMVEQPKRVAALIGDWLADGHARAALFNLKLPMKKRWQETEQCLTELCARLDACAAPAALAMPDGARYVLRAKQLYHDREEISVVIVPGR
jgi:23S rRNA (cytidine2498-2'-O)-methyltransferase